MNHSIPDAVAFAIDSPAGTIIQTGDFKIDYTPLAGGVTDLATFAEYGQKGVLALLSDSTNAERPGFTATEQKVAAGFAQPVCPRRRTSASSSPPSPPTSTASSRSSTWPWKTAARWLFSGRSMVNNTAMALELGYLHVPEGTLIERGSS